MSTLSPSHPNPTHDLSSLPSEFLSISIRSPSLQGSLPLDNIPCQTTLLLLKQRVLQELGITKDDGIGVDNLRVIFAGKLVSDEEQLSDIVSKTQQDTTERHTFHLVFKSPLPSRLTNFQQTLTGASEPAVQPESTSPQSSIENESTGIRYRGKQKEPESGPLPLSEQETTQSEVSTPAVPYTPYVMYNGIPYLINPYANFGYPYPYLYPYYPSAPHMPMQLTPEMLQQLQNLQQPSFPSSYPQPSTPQTIPATPVSSLPPENENPPAFQQNANGQGAHNLQGRAQEPAARQVAVRRVNSLGLFLKLCFFLYLFTRDASFERTIVLHIVAAIIFLYQTGRIRVIRVQRQIVPRPVPEQPDQQQQQQQQQEQQETSSTTTSPSATSETNPPEVPAARPRRLLPELQSIIFSFFGALVPGHLQEDVAHNAAAMIAAQQQQDRERAGDLEVAGAGVGAGGVGGVGGVM